MTSLSRVIRFQSQKIGKFVIFVASIFLNYDTTCDLTDFPASIYDKKRRSDVSTLYATFYDHSVSRNLPKCRNTPISRQREPTA